MADQLVYVGCRTRAVRQARGQGIGVYRIADDGSWREIQLYGTDDPSYLATDNRKRWLYAVEGDGSTISAFERDAEGRLDLLSRTDVHGLNPVDVTISPDDRFAVVCNHVTRDGRISNVAVFPIASDGALGEPSCVLPLSGELGVNRVEQPASKPHQTQFSPDGRTLVVADKGLDEIQFLDLDADGGLSVRERDTVRMPWGAGPRNIAFHPTLPFLYLLNELDSTVVTIALDGEAGPPTPLQRLSSQSDRFSLKHRGASISVSNDGSSLYIGNRGQDTLGVFSIDRFSGSIEAKQWIDSGGRVPRHLALSPSNDWLIVANEFSHDVTRFTRADDGSLSAPAKVLDTGSPTCLLFG